MCAVKSMSASQKSSWDPIVCRRQAYFKRRCTLVIGSFEDCDFMLNCRQKHTLRQNEVVGGVSKHLVDSIAGSNSSSKPRSCCRRTCKRTRTQGQGSRVAPQPAILSVESLAKCLLTLGTPGSRFVSVPSPVFNLQQLTQEGLASL